MRPDCAGVWNIGDFAVSVALKRSRLGTVMLSKLHDITRQQLSLVAETCIAPFFTATAS